MVSSIGACGYCMNVLLDKEYGNEKDKIELIMNQMSYLIEDLEKFGLSIAIDEDIQAYLKGENVEIHQIEKKLGMWEIQRDYIFNLTLTDNEGELVLSDSLRMSGISAHMYRELLGETLENEVDKNKLFKFDSEIRTVQRLTNNNKILSVVMNVYHLGKYQSKLGTLVINLDYDKLSEVILTNLQTVTIEQFYWVGQADGETFFPADISEETSAYIRKISAYMKKRPDNCGRYKSDYIVVREMEDSDWIFLSVTSMADIWKRVLYISGYFLMAGIPLGIIGMLIIKRVVRYHMRPMAELKESMDRIRQDNFEYIPIHIHTQDEFQLLAEGYNNMMERIQSYIIKSVESEKEKKQLEMDFLLAQINPHFIYNTLNTVIYLAYDEDTEGIISMTRSFISLLQNSVRIHEGGLLSTVQEELYIVQTYLNIQHKRYINKFEEIFEVDEEILKKKIMRALLQPIVENGLLHGIFCKEGKGELRLSVRGSENGILCAIEDNGPGMAAEKIQEILNGKYKQKSGGVYSIGLKNIQERLKLIYGETCSLTINSKEGEFFCIEIYVPYIDKDNIV